MKNFFAIGGNYRKIKQEIKLAIEKITIKTRDDDGNGSIVPTKIEDLQKELLKIFSDNNLGIGMYKADASLNNWSEITYNKTNDSLNPPIPCN